MTNDRLAMRLAKLDCQDLSAPWIWKFCLRCVQSVAHHLESDAAINCLAQFQTWVEQGCSPIQTMLTLNERVNEIARSHPGSTSIDGTRHAAVSATHTLAAATRGEPVQAAAYAAYSTVYGYGAYAIADPLAFRDIHQQQVQWLETCLTEHALARQAG